MTAVDDGVGESLTQCGLDLKLFAGGAFQSARHFHDAFHYRTDSGGIGVERDLNAYHQLGTGVLHGRALRSGKIFPHENRVRLLSAEKLNGVKQESTTLPSLVTILVVRM